MEGDLTYKNIFPFVNNIVNSNPYLLTFFCVGYGQGQEELLSTYTQPTEKEM